MALSRLAAQCRAVVPSGSGASIVPRGHQGLDVAVSPFLSAWTSRRSGGRPTRAGGHQRRHCQQENRCAFRRSWPEILQNLDKRRSSRAVPWSLRTDRRYSDSVEQGHEQVVHRRIDRIAEDASALQPARAADEDQRQIDVRVLIRVADAAAVQDERVIEQVAVAFLDALQLLEEVRGQQRQMVTC